MSLLDQIPSRFRTVRYNRERPPLAGAGFAEGANCQHFAYELLRHFGRDVPDLWSSDLWDSAASIRVSAPFEPLDLLLFNRTPDPYGAHLAVYAGDGQAIHLSRKVGHPVVWRIEEFLTLPEYAVLIGGKRYV
jgi:cell wall-associated NlpC family hydrolase